MSKIIHVNNLMISDLRMELLDEPVNQYLIQALYGLLMIMPQSDAFHLLRHRLKCVPHLQMESEKCVLYILSILLCRYVTVYKTIDYHKFV